MTLCVIRRLAASRSAQLGRILVPHGDRRLPIIPEEGEIIHPWSDIVLSPSACEKMLVATVSLRIVPSSAVTAELESTLKCLE